MIFIRLLTCLKFKAEKSIHLALFAASFVSIIQPFYFLSLMFANAQIILFLSEYYAYFIIFLQNSLSLLSKQLFLIKFALKFGYFHYDLILFANQNPHSNMV